MSENKSGIQPIEYRVLVRLDTVEEQTSSGIIIPKAALESIQFAQEKGTLIAFGEKAFEDFPEKEQLKPGVRVMMSKYAGVKVKGVDRVEYQLSNDKDVTAILRKENPNEL